MLEGSGSSPLARGKRWDILAGIKTPGLIPARAGKTKRVARPTARARAHPRSRGENQRQQAMTTLRMGSSPLARGKPAKQIRGRHILRLIPARAGKTIINKSSQNILAAHPRSRGENSRGARRQRCVHGSSPLARGKPPPLLLRRQDVGLIPARAGKTLHVRRLI